MLVVTGDTLPQIVLEGHSDSFCILHTIPLKNVTIAISNDIDRFLIHNKMTSYSLNQSIQFDFIAKKNYTKQKPSERFTICA